MQKECVLMTSPLCLLHISQCYFVFHQECSGINIACSVGVFGVTAFLMERLAIIYQCYLSKERVCVTYLSTSCSDHKFHLHKIIFRKHLN